MFQQHESRISSESAELSIVKNPLKNVPYLRTGMTDILIAEFKAQSIHRIGLNTPRIDHCLTLVNNDDVWKTPNGSTNSIGNLILHLCGNMTQYVVSSLGNTPDYRERDKEFSTKGGFTREQLSEKLHGTVEKVIHTINEAPHSELLRKRSVQGFQYTGIGIVVHVTEHYSYHTGQIALLAKLLSNRDLGFYQGVNLNVKNSSD
jgi:uncharacterized damage-inducible protein DinB